MRGDFKKAVFKLCRKCAESSRAEEIRRIIKNITVIKNKPLSDSPNINNPTHGDLAYIASQNKIQFLGYLLADDSLEFINNNTNFHATHLYDEERHIIETAHLGLKVFIESCISEIKKNFPQSSILVNPYSNYQEPQIKTDAISFFTSEDLFECVESFKEGEIYKKILQDNILCLFENTSEDEIINLGLTLNKQLKKDFNEITDETQDFLKSINKDCNTPPELMIAYSIYCYALQQSLKNAVEMLFEAIIGEEFPVLNNDNIIKLCNKNSNAVYEKYTVLCQDVFFGLSGSKIGSVALLSCEPMDNYHIKEFGEIFSETVSFSTELGQSSKISLVTIDEDLNPIHLLTNRILKSPMGKRCYKVCQQ